MASPKEDGKSDINTNFNDNFLSITSRLRSTKQQYSDFLKKKIELKNSEIKTRLLKKETEFLQNSLNKIEKREEKLSRIKDIKLNEEFSNIKKQTQMNFYLNKNILNLTKRPHSSSMQKLYSKNLKNKLSIKTKEKKSLNSLFCNDQIKQNFNIENNEVENKIKIAEKINYLFHQDNLTNDEIFENDYISNNNIELDEFYIQKLIQRIMIINNAGGAVKKLDIDKYMKNYEKSRLNKKNSPLSIREILFKKNKIESITGTNNKNNIDPCNPKESISSNNDLNDQNFTKKKKSGKYEENSNKSINRQISAIFDLDLNFYRKKTYLHNNQITGFDNDQCTKDMIKNKNFELMIQEYKNNLNKKLEERILLERENEKKRNEKLKNIYYVKEKNRIEEINARERTKAIEDMIEFNEY